MGLCLLLTARQSIDPNPTLVPHHPPPQKRTCSASCCWNRAASAEEEEAFEPSDEAEPWEEREDERPKAARLGGRMGMVGPSDGPPRVPICFSRGNKKGTVDWPPVVYVYVCVVVMDWLVCTLAVAVADDEQRRSGRLSLYASRV